MPDVERIAVGSLLANCYLVSAPSGDAIIIDPGGGRDLIEATVEARQVDVHAVLCTHGHHDHVSAVEVGKTFGAPFHLHPDDAAVLRRINLFRAMLHDEAPIPIPEIDVPLGDGDALRFGALEVDVLHTPGHTPGSVCFEIGGEVFTGDTLSSDGPGSTDLRGADAATLDASVQRLASAFKPQTMLHPGHGASVVLEEALPRVR